MATHQTVEIPIRGMDCAECTHHVQQAIGALPGVRTVTVFLSSEKAVVDLEPDRVTLSAIARVVESAGYSVSTSSNSPARSIPLRDFSRNVLMVLGIAIGAVLFVAFVGERLGLFDRAMDRIPWPVWIAAIFIGGYPIFSNVVRAALKRRIISHTLMTLGVVAALAVGQWATAAVVVLFMRLGDYAERFTTERGRRALRDLTTMAPRTARVERDGIEQDVPIADVAVGDVVVVRPGEKVPVDGEVISGQATVDQAAITGESLPIEVGPGTRVFAASLARLGSVRVRVSGVGAETTFGRVIALVEEAEANRADVQRVADTFSSYYLPVVVGVAAITLLLRHDPLATAAVLVVACSCSFALATPIAMLASIGAGARHGLLIKGGKHLETLDRADVLLIDKTGTLTLGRPRITDVVPLDGASSDGVLALAASAERFSEHPLAEAVRAAARERSLTMAHADQFEAVPGLGVRAHVGGHVVVVGSQRMASASGDPSRVGELEAQGKTTLLVERDGVVVGILAAADFIRPEVPRALAALRALGVRRIEILTGDNERVASAIAGELGVAFRANLLPEDKIAVVKEYQHLGHTVVMVGDGVNDAPALAQADVGIAMGMAGSDVAIEAAHVALTRDDWLLVPEVFQIARRTMQVVKLNIGFTVVYNVVGLSLASAGLLPPVLAAAAQSLPDLGILGNSARLLRQTVRDDDRRLISPRQS